MRLLYTRTCTSHMEFDVHGLYCRASLGRLVWIPLNLKCFWIHCVAFMRPVHMGTVCVVFGATQSGAGWGALSDQEVDFVVIWVASVGVACGTSRRIIENAVK